MKEPLLTLETRRIQCAQLDKHYPIVESLLLADVTATRALAGRRLKTDREDAFNIAELLAHSRSPCPIARLVQLSEATLIPIAFGRDTPLLTTVRDMRMRDRT